MQSLVFNRGIYLSLVVGLFFPFQVVVGQGQVPVGDQPVNREPAGQQVPVANVDQAVQQGIAQVPQQPFPAITAQEQQFLNGVLTVWEQRSAGVDRYTCSFQRWEYDPGRFQHPSNPAASFFSEATGEIRYLKPDKGVYRVDEVKVLANANPIEYRVDPKRPFGEYWICDGNWVYDRDRNTKTEKQFELPPQQRGALIENSPLPFVFGVTAEKLKQRYWLRVIQSNKKTVWIEAWPRRADDAGNYSRVQVVLSRTDILPEALIVFKPNWTAQKDHKEIYQFSNRKESKSGGVMQNFQDFFGGQFIPGKAPNGFKVQRTPWVPPQQRVAMPPGGGVLKPGVPR